MYKIITLEGFTDFESVTSDLAHIKARALSIKNPTIEYTVLHSKADKKFTTNTSLAVYFGGMRIDQETRGFDR